MAVTVKKKALAETTIEKKAKGQVLTSETKQETVETPPYTEKAEAPSEDEQASIAKAQPLAPFCEIGFEASYTHNLGNYESCRVAVVIKIPCLHAEIDEAFEYAKSWVDEKLNQVNSEIKGA